MFQESLFPEDREKLRRSFVFGTPEFKQAYKCYISSPRWRRLCRQVRDRAKNRCEKCGALHGRIEVHHLTYERFRSERPVDLLLLCVRCHECADHQREQENERKFEEAGEQMRYQNGFHTFMEKKYGDEYGNRVDVERGYEEFDEWLRDKFETGD